jgi:hypothetical protein
MAEETFSFPRICRVAITVLCATAFLFVFDARMTPLAAAEETYGCPSDAAPYSKLTFDDREHRLWYRRFWTGSCNGLIFRCLPGAPYWQEMMNRLVQKVPPGRQDEAKNKACIVGKFVGYEWAKDNAIRRIDTADVSAWIRRLENAVDPLGALNDIAGEAKQKVSRQ